MKMNRFTLCLTLLLGLWAALGAQAQVKIGNNPTTISAGSLLELEHKPGSPKSFVPPRMTTAERTAIPTPLVGSMVYNTDKPNSTSANLGCWESYDLTDKDGDGSRWNCIGTVTSTTGTSGTANSGGYINTCGCTNVATIDAGVPANTAGRGTYATALITPSQITTALSNSAVCDIAINFSNTTRVAVGTIVFSTDLPSPSAYAGRIITIHPALPLQFTVSAGGSVIFNVYVPGGGFALTANQPSGAGYGALSAVSTPATTGSSIGNLLIQSDSSNPGNFPAAGVKITPTITIISDGVSWFGTAYTGLCTVLRP